MHFKTITLFLLWITLIYSENIVPGFIILKDGNEKYNKKYIEKLCVDAGINEVSIRAINRNENEQFAKIDELILGGINVIIIEPMTKAGSEEINKIANEKNIKLIEYNSMKLKNTAKIVFDEKMIGEEIGKEYIKWVIGKKGHLEGKLIMFEDKNKAEIQEGFTKGLDSVIKENPEINVSKIDSLKKLKEFLKNEKEGQVVDGIIIQNEEIENEIMLDKNLIDEINRKEIFIVSNNTNNFNMRDIIDGKQSLLIYKNQKDIYKSAVDLLEQMKDKSNIKEQNTINHVPAEIISRRMVKKVLQNSDYYKVEEDIKRERLSRLIVKKFERKKIETNKKKRSRGMYVLKEDFDSGIEEWGSWTGNGGKANIYSKDNSALIKIKNSGKEPWSVQFFSKNFLLEEDYEYELRFETESTSARKIEIIIDDATYKRYAEETILLKKDKEEHSMRFAMNATSEVKINYLVGAVGRRGILSPHNIKIDNIQLEKVQKKRKNGNL